MCSVTWLVNNKGYEIFFNRDEQKTRAAALPPRIQNMDDMKILMPIDPVGQGSWISTNEVGLSLCLLNNYQGRMPEHVLFSRGLLLKTLSKEKSIKDVCMAFERLSLPQFAPFILLAFDLSICQQGQSAMAIKWDGVDKVIEPIEAPLFSSGVNLEEVMAYRYAIYDQVVGSEPTQESLLAFHQHHHPEHSHLSVCMHRDDAETVSFTRVSVSAKTQSMSYVAGALCGHLNQESLAKNTVSFPNKKALEVAL